MLAQTPPVILIGPMGSGKTTVGRILAQQLDVDFIDTDDLFQERHGAISHYFTNHGEKAFRDEEEEVIAEALDRRNLGVISLGGGAVIREANRELIQNRGYVVFLDVSEEHALDRLGDASGRPVLGGDPARNWSRIRAARHDYFIESAHCVVDTTGLDAHGVATKIVEGYQQFLSRKTT